MKPSRAEPAAARKIRNCTFPNDARKSGQTETDTTRKGGILLGVVSTATDRYQKCIDSCNRCSQACLECLKLCLNEPDVGARKNCIASLQECACICREASSFMGMEAPHAAKLCRLCETICSACAQECGMFQDSHCKKCADECNSCADVCKSMSAI